MREEGGRRRRAAAGGVARSWVLALLAVLAAAVILPAAMAGASGRDDDHEFHHHESEHCHRPSDRHECRDDEPHAPPTTSPPPTTVPATTVPATIPATTVTTTSMPTEEPTTTPPPPPSSTIVPTTQPVDPVRGSTTTTTTVPATEDVPAAKPAVAVLARRDDRRLPPPIGRAGPGAGSGQRPSPPDSPSGTEPRPRTQTAAPSGGEQALADPGAPSAVEDDPLFDAHRSPFVDAIPDPRDVSWSPRHLLANLMLVLLLIVMVGFPAELINSTLKEHYDQVNRPFVGVRSALAALEQRLMGVPNAVLLVGFAAVGALISGELDPSFGVNATSLVLFAALALAFVVVTVLLELVRIPYIHNRRRARYRHHLRLFPLALVMAVVFVVLSRVVGFRPGWVFGITCGLLLAPEVGEEEHASSLAVSGVLLLVTSLAAWLAWIPWSSAAQEPHPSLTVVFMDAFLATLWISALQAVIFGFAPLEALYGKTLQRWNFRVWVGLYVAALFFLVQLLLHPSAHRWGGVPSTTFWQMFSLFIVFLLGAIAFWAFYEFRPSSTDGPDRAADTADPAQREPSTR